jgi:hypothetical protein
MICVNMLVISFDWKERKMIEMQKTTKCFGADFVLECHRFKCSTTAVTQVNGMNRTSCIINSIM